MKTREIDGNLLFPGAPKALVDDAEIERQHKEDVEKGLTLLRIMREGVKKYKWRSEECAFQSDSFFIDGPNVFGEMIEATNEWLGYEDEE